MKSLDELAVEYANKASDPEWVDWHVRLSAFKVGHASRDAEVAELKKKAEWVCVTCGSRAINSFARESDKSFEIEDWRAKK